jgi:hypothetical protein
MIKFIYIIYIYNISQIIFELLYFYNLLNKVFKQCFFFNFYNLFYKELQIKKCGYCKQYHKLNKKDF